MGVFGLAGKWVSAGMGGRVAKAGSDDVVVGCGVLSVPGAQAGWTRKKEKTTEK